MTNPTPFTETNTLLAVAEDDLDEARRNIATMLRRYRTRLRHSPQASGGEAVNGTAARDELAMTRAALIAALGGEDSIPEGATTTDMVDALAQLNTYYRRGWDESHARLNQAKRTLRDHGIDAHTTAPGKPLEQDLLAATWSSAPLTDDEARRAEALGIEVGARTSPFPVKWALIRQETAHREAARGDNL